MDVKMKWNKPTDKIAYESTGGDAARLAFAAECKRLMDKYVPARNLVLSQAVNVYVKKGEGYVHYKSPYAHYQYEGVLYVSSLTGSSWARQGEYKVKAEPERQLKHSKARHPKATSHWDKAMKTAYKDHLAQFYEKWLKKNGGG